MFYLASQFVPFLLYVLVCVYFRSRTSQPDSVSVQCFAYLRSGQVLLLFIICVLFLTFRDWQKENEKLLCFGFETELVF